MPLKLRVIHSALMSFFLAFVMTCWVTFLNLGLTDQFIASWEKAFILAWPAAFIISFLCGPAVMKLSLKIAKV